METCKRIAILLVICALSYTPKTVEAILDLSNFCWDLCGWTEWGSWSSCDSTCGGGARTRTRSLCAWMWLDTLRKKLDYCRLSIDGLSQTSDCGAICEHGQWSAWDKECQCDDGWQGYCCNVIDTRVELLEWEDWSSCSQSCGIGVQNRRRVCFDFQTGRSTLEGRCDGALTQMKTCQNANECTTSSSTTTTTTTTAPATTTTTITTTIASTSSKNRLLLVKQLTNVTVSLGEDVILECFTYPEATIHWYFENRQLTGVRTFILPNTQVLTHGILIISPVQREHIGGYKCMAQFEDQILESTAWIHSPDVPTCDIELTKVPEHVAVKIGARLKMFSCVPTISSGITVSWYKDGHPIQLQPPRLKTLVRGRSLLIRDVMVNDSGTYTCVLHNDKCSVNASALLNVYSSEDEICGRPVLHHAARQTGLIIGGEDVRKGAVPWMVMLWESTVQQFCGGVLLNDYWVLTAAHCFVEFHYRFHRHLTNENLVLKLGKYDKSIIGDHERRFSMTAHYIHEHFDYNTFDNDIALIKLHRRVEYTDYIRPVCWQADFNIVEYFLRNGGSQLGKVTGWGITSNTGISPDSLQEAVIPLVDDATCRNSSSVPESITQNMFCAGYRNRVSADACTGDSGGPFTVKVDSDYDAVHYEDDIFSDDEEPSARYFLLGLVSWGESACAQLGKFGFYTKVENYKDWINSIMTDNESRK